MNKPIENTTLLQPEAEGLIDQIKELVDANNAQAVVILPFIGSNMRPDGASMFINVPDEMLEVIADMLLAILEERSATSATGTTH